MLRKPDRNSAPESGARDRGPRSAAVLGEVACVGGGGLRGSRLVGRLSWIPCVTRVFSLLRVHSVIDWLQSMLIPIGRYAQFHDA